MKAKTTKCILAPQRCRHLSPTGRQCCAPAAAPESMLCARHAAAEPQQSVDFSAELLKGCGDFQHAQQINHSLIALYKLLAQGRISPDDEPGDEPGDDPGEAPLAEPVAANPVGPGKEPLPATAQEFAAQVLNRKPN